MKRLLFNFLSFSIFIFMLYLPIIAESQSIEEIQNEIKSQCKIDENGNISYQKIIEVEGMSKDDIYDIVQGYFTYNYRNDARSLIEMQDKGNGLLLAKGYYIVRGQPNNDAGTYALHVIKAEVKDNKVRVTITLTKYEIPSSVVFGIVNNISESCPISPNFNNKKWWARTFFIAHKCVLQSFSQMENSLKKKEDHSW